MIHLYQTVGSSNAQRVRIVLAEKDLRRVRERLFGDEFKFPNPAGDYAYADELVAWERDFDAYVSQWFPVRRDLPLRR